MVRMFTEAAHREGYVEPELVLHGGPGSGPQKGGGGGAVEHYTNGVSVHSRGEGKGLVVKRGGKTIFKGSNSDVRNYLAKQGHSLKYTEAGR